MISGIFKKVILYFLFSINIFQPLKSAEESQVIRSINNRNTQLRWSKISHQEILSNSSKTSFKNDFVKNIADEKFLEKNINLYLAANSEKQQELIIQSDKQSEINDVIYAEGNVSVSYRGKLLKADTLSYDKSKKTLKASGNIYLTFGNQSFEMEDLLYDFENKKGSLYKVNGLINIKNFINEINYNFDDSDSQQTKIFKDLRKNFVLNTPYEVINWAVSTNKLEIDGNTWKSEKALFTNDLLELNQVKLVFNSLEITPKKEELIVNSSINYLILDESFSIPFWFGERTIDTSEDKLFYRWQIGYDKLDKDGYFIGRKLEPINLSEDIVIDIEPQFLIERSLKGYTNSFVNNGDSITSKRVKQESNFEDYFALNSQTKGKLNDWNWEIKKQLNSFDSSKFLNALRLKTKLSKEVYVLNSIWNQSFYGVYRDRVWNGSLGESEIYLGYGSKLEKRNSWEVNGISKTEKLSIGLGNFKGKALKSTNLVNSIKGNVFYSLNQKFPILVDYPPNNFVDSSFKYIPKPVTKGLKFDTKLELYSSIYENGHNQSYIGFGAGPEFTFGDFKSKSFDYTKFSLMPFYRVMEGESPFKFDNVADKFTLDISFDQQIYGPIVLKSKGILNLDSNSEDYGEFIESSISLNWKKRSYEVGLFYQPYNETGGIAFTLFGFK